MWLGLDPAAKIHPLYRWFLISMLVIYVPGMSTLPDVMIPVLTKIRELYPVHPYDGAAQAGAPGEEQGRLDR